GSGATTRSTVASWSSCRFVRAARRKPISDAETVYTPGVRPETVYDPSARVVALRVMPVASLVALTVAPSRGAPTESRMTPLIRLLEVCANAGTLYSAAARATDMKRRVPRQSMEASGQWEQTERSSSVMP